MFTMSKREIDLSGFSEEEIANAEEAEVGEDY
jgi:hypothetical protein